MVLDEVLRPQETRLRSHGVWTLSTESQIRGSNIYKDKKMQGG